MIKHLKLTNFRSHQEGEWHFGELTIIVGPNGVGKTNILEAISLVSTTRSWRTSSDREVINLERDFARVEADDLVLTLRKNPYQKEVLVDGVKRPLKEVIGRLKTVLFEPEDLQLVLGSPATRRHFLNVVLAQADRQYSEALIAYRQVLIRRNKLLKHIAAGKGREGELNFWDDELTNLASTIWSKRHNFIALAKQKLADHYQAVSQDDKEATLRLETHPADTDRLSEELAAVRDHELMLGQTVRGPHRDELILRLGEVLAKSTASRGEIRSLVFALKMIELDFLSNHLPALLGKVTKTASADVTLLLDDVMSELDANRRRRLVEVVNGVQTIITTTDLDHIPKELREQAVVIELSATSDNAFESVSASGRSLTDSKV